MGTDNNDGGTGEVQRRLLHTSLTQNNIGIGDLWLRYFSNGGNAGEYEIDAYIHGSFPLPRLDRDLLAYSANELFDELPPPPRAPYSDEITHNGRQTRREENGQRADEASDRHSDSDK